MPTTKEHVQRTEIVIDDNHYLTVIVRDRKDHPGEREIDISRFEGAPGKSEELLNDIRIYENGEVFVVYQPSDLED